MRERFIRVEKRVVRNFDVDVEHVNVIGNVDVLKPKFEHCAPNPDGKNVRGDFATEIKSPRYLL